MNTSDTMFLTTQSANASVAEAADTGLLTTHPTVAEAATTLVMTTVAPASPDSAVIAVVIVLILLTVAALVFLLYRYLCHNKGDYRTTGELAPGEDPDEEHQNHSTGEKKEYFI